MSKKSRRRNKKILSALLLGGLGLAAANRNKGPVSTKTTIMDNMPKDDIEFKENVVSTPKTIMDSMPVRPKKNVLSKRVTDKGEVYTIKGASEGVPKKLEIKKLRLLEITIFIKMENPTLKVDMELLQLEIKNLLC